MARESEERGPTRLRPRSDRKKKTPSEKGGGGLLAKTPVLLGIGHGPRGGRPLRRLQVPGRRAQGRRRRSSSPRTRTAGGEHGDGHGEGQRRRGKTKPTRKKLVELNVVDFKAPNTQNGRRYHLRRQRLVSVKGEVETKVKDMIKDREALIKDRVRTIIGADGSGKARRGFRTRPGDPPPAGEDPA